CRSHIVTRPPTRSTLFPYTTLFRSPNRRWHMSDQSTTRYSLAVAGAAAAILAASAVHGQDAASVGFADVGSAVPGILVEMRYFGDRKSTRLNSSHVKISYAVFCLKK